MSQKILYEQLEIKKEKVESLEKHLKELEDIRMKALQTLVDLDAKRVKMQNEISEANKLTRDMKEEEKQLRRRIEKIKKEVDFTQQAKVQKVVTNLVYVGIPQQHKFSFKQDISLVPQQ